MTLTEARDDLFGRLNDGDQVVCPCCDQFAKVYKRKINSGIARALIVMYRAAGTGWLHKPTVLKGVGAAARDESISRYWGLMEEQTELRTDGGRSGWWRVTVKGAKFVLGELAVPRYAFIYNNSLITLAGAETSVYEALGERFSYRELMA